MPDMTDATPTIEEMVAAVEWQVRKLDSFTRNHPRRSDAPPGPDLADRELAKWRAVLSALSSLSPLIEAARKLLALVESLHEDPDDGPIRNKVWLDAMDEARRTLSTFPAPASPWRPIETFSANTNRQVCAARLRNGQAAIRTADELVSALRRPGHDGKTRDIYRDKDALGYWITSGHERVHSAAVGEALQRGLIAPTYPNIGDGYWSLPERAAECHELWRQHERRELERQGAVPVRRKTPDA